jgi:cytochrome c peroxidase
LNKRRLIFLFTAAAALAIIFSFSSGPEKNEYKQLYYSGFRELYEQQKILAEQARVLKEGDNEALQKLSEQLRETRYTMKQVDFWLRYLAPLSQKKINGPLPVEWETEVFEKFEAPYKRDGAGLTLAYLHIGEPGFDHAQLRFLLNEATHAVPELEHDTIVTLLDSHHHFFLCNRLYLLNLATIYTTGFECPDADAVIPELRMMMQAVKDIYTSYDRSFPQYSINTEYLLLYDAAISFTESQPADYTRFDHYRFIRDYVNPLFSMNQQMLRQHNVVSKSLLNYSLNKHVTSIFSKSLYFAQNPKGIFLRVDDEKALAELENTGRMLFYDPILSANNERSCASCHKPGQYFTDTFATTPERFNRQGALPRNTPSLLNAQYNHLIMLDGKHITLQAQTRDVITNAEEMGSNEAEMIRKVMSCKTYSTAFNRLLKYTPQEKQVTADHIASAITYYYSKFSRDYAPFDAAMNRKTELQADEQAGFNVFMGKAQCGTCHFAPQFNGIKPPYVGSEFEVLGVPADTGFSNLSSDKGRYVINPAYETANAFRTGTLRNITHTAPYMHNGIFKTLEEVIDFYNNGGGAGRGLAVENQTLSADTLGLTTAEKKQLVAFMHSLSEQITFEQAPETLPRSSFKELNKRIPGGTY